MKIFEKEFKKLSQLDRIEYLLKKQDIGDIPIYPNTILYSIIVIFGWLILVSAMINLSLHGYTTYIPNIAISFTAFGFILCMLVDLLLLVRYRTRSKALFEEYFQVNIKKNK